ncbi:MAG: nuclear transport factor 2 family protein [Oscillospiraceae bacterium]|nr:nuclear transport factor 2 family protein [Oscillospiraceae bacterium]
MFVNSHSREQTLNRWEELREIKNLIGRFSMDLFHKNEDSIFREYWSCSDQVCLGVNNGWYLGAESVASHFQSLADRTACADLIIRTRFPSLTEHLSPQEKGLGSMDVYSLSTDLVTIAEDEQTAKGMWTCAGQKVEYSAAGPYGQWFFGIFAVDFINENNSWKIWHMQYLEEIKTPQGKTWWEEAQTEVSIPDFAPLKSKVPPSPDVEVCLCEYYGSKRPFPKYPLPPEQYSTFSETFSYGFSQEVTAK